MTKTVFKERIFNSQYNQPPFRGHTNLLVRKKEIFLTKRLFFLYVGRKNLVKSKIFKLNLK